ncbi:MAG: TerB family tellurite resistance protein [Verrucomicrobia bacterium]|nr:TerB family tellurite resistance protein [Verrucomicrobiota bacterium]MBU1736180.1 TerB family tellurite resistance protein [Verrucomicrobiota bacterium]MBU1856780.1 TerB family tellurite resistance protein [Verrucomicrobiota bacterium]
MVNRLYGRGRCLAEQFFKKHDAILIEQYNQLDQMKRNHEALAAVSGISNPMVLKKLAEFEVSPHVLASLAVIPLVEVAWASGKVNDSERKAVLAGAAGTGIARGSMDYALLDEWLKHRPPPKLLEAWRHYISGLCETMSAEERETLRSDLFTLARRVAEADGGFLNLVSKISAEEQAVLDRLESAFPPPHPSGH